MTDTELNADQQDIENVPGDAGISSEVSGDDAQAQLFDSATVQKVVARERLKAYEKGKREAMMEQQQQQDAMQQQAPQAQALQQQQQLGGMQQLSQADIERMIAEKAAQHFQEQMPGFLQGQVQQHQNEQLVNSFVAKMQAAEQKYPGLESKLNKLDYRKEGTRELVKMANDMENTGDIMQEILVANPSKFGQIVSMIYEQPEVARDMLASLSNSIKQNQEAIAGHDPAQNPLSQLTPSAIAGMDNGKMSVSDFSNYFRNKRAGK